MYLHHVLHGLILSAAVASAFLPYVPKKVNGAMRAGESQDDWSGWKPVKDVKDIEERDTAPFVPVRGNADVKALGASKWVPVVPRDGSSATRSLKMKRLARPNSGLDHPGKRHVQQADTITRKYKRTLEKRGRLTKRQADTFLRSNDPSTPDSLAVHQDGQDFSYFAEVNFGSKNKTFLVVIDTGSSDTWIPSADCKSAACDIHETFGDDDSTTTEPTDKTFQITYGSGQVDGIVVQDDVSFAGFTINTEFGLATTVSNEFVNFPIDGIMGLGFREASQQRVKTIMDQLVDNGLIDNKIFAVALSRAEDRLNDGVLNFGGIDESYFDGELSFSDSVSDIGLWEIAVDDIGHDGVVFDFPRRTAVIDTGTSLILLPRSDALKVHSVVTGAQTNGETFAVPCETDTTLEFTFAGVTYKIPATDWVGEILNAAQDMCLSHLLGREILGPSTWLLGDVFLKNVYTVFDMDENRVGFGNRKSPEDINNKPTPTTTSSYSSSTAPSPTDTPNDINPPAMTDYSNDGNENPGSPNDGSPFEGGGSGASGLVPLSISAFVGIVMSLLYAF